MSNSRMVSIVQDSLRPSIREQVIVNGRPFDLTGWSVHFTMQPYQGGALTLDHVPAVVEVGQSGWWHYDWQGSDTSAAGRYKGEANFTDPAGNPATLPTAAKIPIVVTRKLAA